MPAEQFVSETITPDAGTFGVAAMARGEPGLPAGFVWRGGHYAIAELLSSWKSNGTTGEALQYLRRHWYKVRADSGQIMTIYCLRQAKDKHKRWCLYSVEGPTEPAQPA
jgi:Domain of unknown function (DUF6504)